MYDVDLERSDRKKLPPKEGEDHLNYAVPRSALKVGKYRTIISHKSMKHNISSTSNNTALSIRKKQQSNAFDSLSALGIGTIQNIGKGQDEISDPKSNGPRIQRQRVRQHPDSTPTSNIAKTIDSPDVIENQQNCISTDSRSLHQEGGNKKSSNAALSKIGNKLVEKKEETMSTKAKLTSESQKVELKTNKNTLPSKTNSKLSENDQMSNKKQDKVAPLCDAEKNMSTNGNEIDASCNTISVCNKSYTTIKTSTDNINNTPSIHDFKIGTLVSVKELRSPLRQGGVGRITKLWPDNTYTVHFVMGGWENNIHKDRIEKFTIDQNRGARNPRRKCLKKAIQEDTDSEGNCIHNEEEPTTEIKYFENIADLEEGKSLLKNLFSLQKSTLGSPKSPQSVSLNSPNMKSESSSLFAAIHIAVANQKQLIDEPVQDLRYSTAAKDDTIPLSPNINKQLFTNSKEEFQMGLSIRKLDKIFSLIQDEMKNTIQLPALNSKFECIDFPTLQHAQCKRAEFDMLSLQRNDVFQRMCQLYLEIKKPFGITQQPETESNKKTDVKNCEVDLSIKNNTEEEITRERSDADGANDAEKVSTNECTMERKNSSAISPKPVLEHSIGHTNETSLISETPTSKLSTLEEVSGHHINDNSVKKKSRSASGRKQLQSWAKSKPFLQPKTKAQDKNSDDDHQSYNPGAESDGDHSSRANKSKELITIGKNNKTIDTRSQSTLKEKCFDKRKCSRGENENHYNYDDESDTYSGSSSSIDDNNYRQNKCEHVYDIPSRKDSNRKQYYSKVLYTNYNQRNNLYIDRERRSRSYSSLSSESVFSSEAPVMVERKNNEKLHRRSTSIRRTPSDSDSYSVRRKSKANSSFRRSHKERADSSFTTNKFEYQDNLERRSRSRSRLRANRERLDESRKSYYDSKTPSKTSYSATKSSRKLRSEEINRREIRRKSFHDYEPKYHEIAIHCGLRQSISPLARSVSEDRAKFKRSKHLKSSSLNSRLLNGADTSRLSYARRQSNDNFISRPRSRSSRRSVSPSNTHSILEDI